MVQTERKKAYDRERMRRKRSEDSRLIRELRAELDGVASAIGSVRWMDPPDGGSVSIAEQVRRMRDDLDAAERLRH